MAEVDPKLCIALDDINEAMDCENQDNMKVCRNARCTFFLVYHRYKSVYFLQAAIIRRFH